MPTNPRNINTITRTTSRGFARSLPNAGDLAEESLARDVELCSSDEEGADIESDDESDTSTVRPSTSAPDHGTNYGFVGSYRRPSFANAGTRSIFYSRGNPDKLTKEERNRAYEEERSLLRDNNLIPPKHPASPDTRRHSRFGIPISKEPSRDSVVSVDDDDAVPAAEITPLLGDPALPYGGADSHQNIAQKWDEAVAAGKISTTWQREAKVITRYALPLMLTFILQYSLTVASIFTVGHIGTNELGAVSLASMSANITGYAIYQGMATSLDTLCAQAYGSGRKKLVGLQMQRMVYFLWALTIPIAVIWLCADKILMAIVPEQEVAALAGLYLKIVLAGAPGYATFEAGKRYVQAQGMFSASLYVLIVLAPLNAFMNWAFVWKLNMGFAGAPLAVAITDNLLPLGLFIYVRFFSKSGMSCWNGFSKKALQNWSPMIKLALPGVIMVEAEMIAFEVLTFGSSFFGSTILAAQSVLGTLTGITFQIPFPLSIAGSTRVANLIGATLAPAAKVSSRVTFVASLAVGVFNVTLLSTLKNEIPKLFTSDPEVVRIVASILPLCASFQLFDATAACCNGLLRGLGRQEIGGYIQIFAYYAIAMPISFGTAFGLGWGLWGLWTGVSIALGIVSVIEFVYLYGVLDWEKSVDEARERNLAD